MSREPMASVVDDRLRRDNYSVTGRISMVYSALAMGQLKRPGS